MTHSAKRPDRECGTCSLCCKLLGIAELDKPEARWCPHCAPGKGGCQIYESRPAACQGFHCAWLQSSDFGPEWKPTISKMVLAREHGEVDRVTIFVDPSFPTAWQREPYYSRLRSFAVALGGKVEVLVRISDRCIVLLPDKNVDLGPCHKDDLIWIGRSGNTGEWHAFRRPAQATART
jgi:hypothetical protein